ncbi:hypothetical protein [Flammeovirga kamogawensis]|uniref:Bacteriocin n=1 Tax=Flammeovirga kamogawensis TaxID=373891 RepID=A0ABX8GRS0_9BACT|nr:hypothetical protein [Flammeovirga kamogawensis]MBB6461378.1 hypothetical protein [Flammeovirga kamogawensis]QWG06279.1 hypothetical protein KM029_13150 [Flammeovirga kamogawensis]
MSLEKFGLKELTQDEKKNTIGGADYHWYSGSNPLVYFGYAVYNGGVAIYNAWNN